MTNTHCYAALPHRTPQTAAHSPCKAFDNTRIGERPGSPSLPDPHSPSATAATQIPFKKVLDLCSGSSRSSSSHQGNCSNNAVTASINGSAGLGSSNGHSDVYHVACAPHLVARNGSVGAGGNNSCQHTSSTQSGVSSKLPYESCGGNSIHSLVGKLAPNGLTHHVSSGGDEQHLPPCRCQGSSCTCGGCSYGSSSPSYVHNNHCCLSPSCASPPSSPAAPLRQHSYQRFHVHTKHQRRSNAPKNANMPGTGDFTGSAASASGDAVALASTGSGCAGSISSALKMMATENSACNGCCCYGCAPPPTGGDAVNYPMYEKGEQRTRDHPPQREKTSGCSCGSHVKGARSPTMAHRPLSGARGLNGAPSTAPSATPYTCNKSPSNSRGPQLTGSLAAILTASGLPTSGGNLAASSGSPEPRSPPALEGKCEIVLSEDDNRSAMLRGGVRQGMVCSSGSSLGAATAVWKALDQFFDAAGNMEKAPNALKETPSTAEETPSKTIKKPLALSELTGGVSVKAVPSAQGASTARGAQHRSMGSLDPNPNAESKNGCRKPPDGASANDGEGPSYSYAINTEPYRGPDPLPPCLYRRLYDPQGPVLFTYPPLQGARHPRAELRLWPRDADCVISQNSSKRKVHRACWLSPLDKKVAFPVALKFVEDGNLRDGRSIKREIECHLYIYQRLGQLMQQHHSTIGAPPGSGVVNKPYHRIEDVWPCAEMLGYYLDRKNPGLSVLITRKLSGPDFFDVIRTEHTSVFNARTAVLYEQHKLQWCLIAMERIAQYGRLGIRHNDIKPDNIVLDFHAAPDSNERLLDVKLIDLGTASMLHAKDFTGGTSWYESPEQKILEFYTKKQRNLEAAKQIDIGLPSDAWGAGLSITEVLMGRRVVDVMKPPQGPGPLEFRGPEGWVLPPKEWAQCARQALGLDREQQRFPLCAEAARHVFSMLVGAKPSNRATVEDVLPHLRLFAEEAALQVYRKYHGGA